MVPHGVEPAAQLLAGYSQQKELGTQQFRPRPGLQVGMQGKPRQVARVLVPGIDGLGHGGITQPQARPVPADCQQMRQGRAPAAATGHSDGVSHVLS